MWRFKMLRNGTTTSRRFITSRILDDVSPEPKNKQRLQQSYYRNYTSKYKGCFSSVTCCRTMKYVEEKQPNSLLVYPFLMNTKCFRRHRPCGAADGSSAAGIHLKLTSILSRFITNPHAFTQDVRSVRQPIIIIRHQLNANEKCIR